MKQKTTNILISLIFIVGLVLFLYPVVGNILNEFKNNYEISQYVEVVNQNETNIYDEMFLEAREINKSLSGVTTEFDKESTFYKDYKSALCLSDGLLGYLTIDKIDVHLTIKHGTTEEILRDSIGYLEGTHLPTGDIGNSTVLTGHTGLPSANLLTNLDQLEIGDTFKLTILNREFTYEVFEINVVLPYEVDTVEPRSDIDMVTLVTCTPYGVNSHRLLVHGKQIPNVEEDLENSSSLGESNSHTMIVLVCMGILIILLIIYLLISDIIKKLNRKKRRMRRCVDEKSN